jgi:hypothetical protein
MIRNATKKEIKGTISNYVWICPCGKRIYSSKRDIFLRKKSQEKFSCKDMRKIELEIAQWRIQSIIDAAIGKGYEKLYPNGDIRFVSNERR